MSEDNQKQPFYIKHFQILVVLLFLVLLIPGYLFFISPERRAYGEHKQLFLTQEQELAQKKTQLMEYKKNLMSYEGISPADRQKIVEILPYGPDEANLYVNLSAIASDLGVKLDDLSIQTNQGKNIVLGDSALAKDKAAAGSVQLRTTLANIKLSAVNYATLKKCLETIEANTKLLDIQSFDFNPTDATLSLTMATYYLQ